MNIANRLDDFEWFLLIVAVSLVCVGMVYLYQRRKEIIRTTVWYTTRHISHEVVSYSRHRLKRFQYNPYTKEVTVGFNHRHATLTLGEIENPMTGSSHRVNTLDEMVELLLWWITEAVIYAHAPNTRAIRWSQSRTDLVILLSEVIRVERGYIERPETQSLKAIRWYYDDFSCTHDPKTGVHTVIYRDKTYTIPQDDFDLRHCLQSDPSTDTLDTLIQHVMTQVNLDDPLEVYGNTDTARLLADIYEDELHARDDREAYIEEQRLARARSFVLNNVCPDGKFHTDPTVNKGDVCRRDRNHMQLTDDWDPPIPTHIALGVAGMGTGLSQDKPSSPSGGSGSSYTSDSSSSDSSSCD